MAVSYWIVAVVYFSGLSLVDRVKALCTSTPSNHQNLISQDCGGEVQCQPGYIHQQHMNHCSCSAGTKSGYYGIETCDMRLQQAYIDHQFWVGYEHGKNESENTLLSGHFPKSFCSPQNGYLLPATASRSLLEDAVCAPNRTGVLCGICKANYSARYHSLTLKCQPNVHCKWGWAFYLISEIVPVTVIFLLIILCNVSLTSGVANSFLFYAQTVKMLRIRGNTLTKISPAALYLVKIHQFIYFFLNLDPFVLDEIAYCVTSKASALDIFSFSNITVTYSFFLMVVTTIAASKCAMPTQSLSRRRAKKMTIQGNVIHGLSSFLLLFSSRCAHNSILILGYIEIYGKEFQKRKTVARYNGEIEWMSAEHLLYAAPALLLLIITTIPVVILMVYPIHYKVLSALRVSESSYIRLLFSPLERLKPFFDSFQGYYKDYFRFFSGLYFVYRILVSVIMASLKPTDAYFCVSVLFSILLVLHAVCQPYVRRLHNSYDILLLFNLLLINMITAYTVSKAKDTDGDSLSIAIASWIQMILIFAPLVTLILPLKGLIVKLRGYCTRPNSIEISRSVDYGTISGWHR